MTLARRLFRLAVPTAQAVGDGERGEGEWYEGGDALAWLQAQGGFWAGLFYRAGEHAAGVGDGVLHLAAGGDDVEDGGADLVRVVAVGLAELAVGGGVEVEAVDPDPDLVGCDGGAGVEPPGGLREDAGRLQDAVQPERAGGS